MKIATQKTTICIDTGKILKKEVSNIRKVNASDYYQYIIEIFKDDLVELIRKEVL